jgi:hypothetical protein
MTRDDARTSWCDETTGGRHNKRTRRGNVTTSWRDETTRGAVQQEDGKRQCNNQLVRQEGKWAARQEAVRRDERQDGGVTRGNATTSRHEFT